MRRMVLAILLVTIGVIGTAGYTAETSRGNTRLSVPASTPKKYCDPVCELKSQDWAFALLMEVYREHQSFQIDSDFHLRQRQIANLRQDGSSWVVEDNSPVMKKLRELVTALARAERDLRMAKLETQVVNFQSAYSCARKIDEDYIGEKVARVIDRQVTQAQIRELVVIAPGSIGQGDIAHAPSIPASSVLLDAPPVAPIIEDVVAPCD